MRLLLAEDEPAMSEAVADILAYHGYSVDAVANGDDALAYALMEKYDGAIFDIMMPGQSGLEVLKKLRERGIRTPVLLLTAKSDVEDRITGLDLGADDYLPKPFNMGELLARVRAMLRRREEFTPDILVCGNVSLNTGNKTLERGNDVISLSKQEYRLMELFMLNKGVFLSSEQILERVWGYDTDVDMGVVWVYISNLRKKLAALDSDAQISSKRGIGYALEETP